MKKFFWPGKNYFIQARFLKMKNQQLHESGLNVIENPDGSFAFEWDPKDPRWEWMNGLTDDQLRIIIQEAAQVIKQVENDG